MRHPLQTKELQKIRAFLRPLTETPVTLALMLPQNKKNEMLPGSIELIRKLAEMPGTRHFPNAFKSVFASFMYLVSLLLIVVYHPAPNLM